jgi:hypothetical protein
VPLEGAVGELGLGEVTERLYEHFLFVRERCHLLEVAASGGINLPRSSRARAAKNK